MRIVMRVLGILVASLLVMAVALNAAGYGIPGYHTLYAYVHDVSPEREPVRLASETTPVTAKDNGYGTQPYAENILVNDSDERYLILRIGFDAYGSPDYKTGSCSQTFINVKPHSRMRVMALCDGGGITSNRDVTMIEKPRIYGY